MSTPPPTDTIAIVIADRSCEGTWLATTAEAEHSVHATCHMRRDPVVQGNYDYLAAYTERVLSTFLDKMGLDAVASVSIRRKRP